MRWHGGRQLLYAIVLSTSLTIIHKIELCGQPRPTKESGSTNALPNVTFDTLWPTVHPIQYVQIAEQGRIGNLLFQSMAIIGISHDNERIPCMLSLESPLRKYFNGPFSPPCQMAPNPTKIDMSHFATFESKAVDLPSAEAIKLVGYLQSWRYWANLPAEAVYSALTFQDHVRKEADTFLDGLPAGKINVGIHVRHTDLITHGYIRFPPQGYFQAALRRFRALLGVNVQFIVASDDIKWCAQQPYFQAPDVHMINLVTEPIVDMCILATCDHMVLSVGTFGWWSAYLGAHRHGGDVVYYKDEFDMEHIISKGKVKQSDYFPLHWIEMDGEGAEVPGGTLGEVERSEWVDHRDDKYSHGKSV